MIEFIPYSKEEHLPEVLSAFRSNIPKYFFDFEEEGLLDYIDSKKLPYFVIKVNGIIVGAGGYALNKDDTVSLCWGMVHQDHHGKHFGEELLKFRLNTISKIYPGKTIVNVTSQHTTGFFEKYGFKIVSVKENGFGPNLHECKMVLAP